jgi:hypothetical protein
MQNKIVMMLGFFAMLANAQSSSASEREIYRCSNFGLENYSETDNPARLKSVTVTVSESDLMTAGRPKVSARVTFIDREAKEGDFHMPLVGIPEFIGVNMYHAYFMGRYTSHTDTKPEQFELVSPFSMSGSELAWLDINISAYWGVVLHKIIMKCELLQPNIYVTY